MHLPRLFKLYSTYLPVHKYRWWSSVAPGHEIHHPWYVSSLIRFAHKRNKWPYHARKRIPQEVLPYIDKPQRIKIGKISLQKTEGQKEDPLTLRYSLKKRKMRGQLLQVINSLLIKVNTKIIDTPAENRKIADRSYATWNHDYGTRLLNRLDHANPTDSWLSGACNLQFFRQTPKDNVHNMVASMVHERGQIMAWGISIRKIEALQLNHKRDMKKVKGTVKFKGLLQMNENWSKLEEKDARWKSNERRKS